ncbi:MAG: hypothetical protein AAF965_11225, partial [Pseudomonadota bacterium]
MSTTASPLVWSTILYLGLTGASPASEQPLSAIDWLQDPAPINLSDPLQVALPGPSDASGPDQTGVSVPEIEVTPLG